MPTVRQRMPAFARSGRAAVAVGKSVSVQWYGDKVLSRITTTLGHRVRIATLHLKSKTIANIRKPVEVSYTATGSEQVTVRSKPGEFPRQETGRLMSEISTEVRQVRGSWEGFVYSTTPYALRLEEHLNRSFLRRTALEEAAFIKKIMSGRIR